MSYILDALNKSEEEKQQHRTPSLNTIHQKPDRKRSQGSLLDSNPKPFNSDELSRFDDMVVLL